MFFLVGHAGPARAWPGVAVALSRKPELITRWTTWALIVPVVGLPIWTGRGATAVLAAALGGARGAGVRAADAAAAVDRALLLVLAVGYPLLAWLAPAWLDLAPLSRCSARCRRCSPGTSSGGIRRAAFTAFGSIWICWSLAQLVVLWENAFLVCFAAGRHRRRGLVRRARACAASAGPAARSRR